MYSQAKIGIVGGGAVGLVYAACLADVGIRVAVKTHSQEQADKIKINGINLLQNKVEEQVKNIDASADPSILADCVAIVVAVKSYDTEAIAKEISPFLKRDAEVVSLQNGLQAADILRANIQDAKRIFAGVTYIGGIRKDDRTVELGNNRKTVLDSRAKKLIEALDKTRYKVEVATNIEQAVWGKMVLNNGQNALSAVTNLSLGEMLQSEYCLDIARRLLAEFEKAANAEGIIFDYDLMDKLKDNWKMSNFYPSMWQDLHKGSRTEIDAINGAVSTIGKKHGIATPYNDMITSLIKIQEARVKKSK